MRSRLTRHRCRVRIEKLSLWSCRESLCNTVPFQKKKEKYWWHTMMMMISFKKWFVSFSQDFNLSSHQEPSSSWWKGQKIKCYFDLKLRQFFFYIEFPYPRKIETMSENCALMKSRFQEKFLKWREKMSNCTMTHLTNYSYTVVMHTKWRLNILWHSLFKLYTVHIMYLFWPVIVLIITLSPSDLGSTISIFSDLKNVDNLVKIMKYFLFSFD